MTGNIYFFLPKWPQGNDNHHEIHVGVYHLNCYKRLTRHRSKYTSFQLNETSCKHTLNLTLSLPEKLKNSILEMPIITQTLNINNFRTTSAKSINQHIIRKLVEYSIKNVPAMFTLTVFEILLSEGRSVLWPAQLGTGSERVKAMIYFNDAFYWYLLFICSLVLRSFEVNILVCCLWYFKNETIQLLVKKS